jgi:hypothetical protein
VVWEEAGRTEIKTTTNFKTEMGNDRFTGRFSHIGEQGMRAFVLRTTTI